MNKYNNYNQKEKPQVDILTYIEPDRPLTYNFFDVTELKQLLDKEPTSGKRKQKDEGPSEVKQEQKQELKQQLNNQEEDDFKGKKNKNETNEIFEGNLIGDLDENTKGKKSQESKMKNSFKGEAKKEEQKKKIIKYKKYTNAFNVSNNKLTTIKDIKEVLISLLPELTFSTVNKKLNKVDLIQWIDISRNKLIDIHEDIAKLPYLKILYVHGNNIKEIERVTALGKCKSLTSLTLYGNPIDHIRGYRHFIIEMCPVLEKLDSAVISEKELDIIKFGGSHYGERRNKDGTVVRYPKLPEEILQTLRMAEQNAAEKKEDN